jgi:hypothetical protein
MHQEESSIYSVDTINNGALLQKQRANPTCPKQFVQLAIIPGGYIEAQITLAVRFYILAPKLLALLLDYDVKEVALPLL